MKIKCDKCGQRLDAVVVSSGYVVCEVCNQPYMPLFYFSKTEVKKQIFYSDGPCGWWRCDYDDEGFERVIWVSKPVDQKEYDIESLKSQLKAILDVSEIGKQITIELEGFPKFSCYLVLSKG